MITQEEAQDLAAQYLNDNGPQFFYKFVEVKRSKLNPKVLSVQFLWSNDANSFTIDGPIFVDIDGETGSVLVD